MEEKILLAQLSAMSEQYADMLRNVKRNLDKAPAGTLQTIPKSGRPYYYHETKDAAGKNTLKYLSKKGSRALNRLAQKKYDSMLLPQLERNIAALNSFIENFQFDYLEQSYVEFNDNGSYSITPHHRSISDTIKKWKNEDLPTNNHFPEAKTYETENGELVRSKSEVIIANTLNRYSDRLLYKYELPIRLKGANGLHVAYPDFTILNCETGKISYWEHFGMMDDPTYLDSFMNKIDDYSHAGIVQGKNFFMTFESSGHTLNTQAVKSIIKQLL